MVEEFEFIPPMKAALSSQAYLQTVDNDENYAAGEKFDGYREQVHFGTTRNEMFSSGGNSHIAKCPQFQVVVSELAGTIIDCEGLSPTRMLEDNAACFKADPANAIAWQDKHGMATLVTFDLLSYKGTATMHLTFRERRQLLEKVYFELIRHNFWNTQLRLEALVTRSKLSYYESIVAQPVSEGHEGVILKRMDAIYQPGSRGDAWLKVKREERLICTITGFMKGTGQFTDMVGSLKFRTDEGFEGYTSGMSYAERANMTSHWDNWIGKQIYVTCQEVTRLGALRHPRYEGLYNKSQIIVDTLEKEVN